VAASARRGVSGVQGVRMESVRVWVRGEGWCWEGNVRSREAVNEERTCVVRGG